MEDTKTIKDEKALSLALDIALKRNEDEQKRKENLNSRANNLMGYAATLGALYYGIVSQKIINNDYLLFISFFVFAIESFVIILCLMASNAFLFTEFFVGPGGKVLNKSGKDLLETQLKIQILEKYTNGYEQNYKRNITSANNIKWAMILFSFGFFFGLLGFIIHLLT